MEGFTRQEAIKLSGVSSSDLSYFDRCKLIQPQKRGNPKHPEVTYSLLQVLKLKVVEHLRSQISLQSVRPVLDAMDLYTPNSLPIKANLYLIDFTAYFVWDDHNFGMLLTHISSHISKRLIVHNLGTIEEPIKEMYAIGHAEVLDFAKRVYGTVADQSSVALKSTNSNTSSVLLR